MKNQTPSSFPSSPQQPIDVFVTVGSTSFTQLIVSLLQPSALSLFPPKSTLTVQYGSSDIASILLGSGGLGDGGDDAGGIVSESEAAMETPESASAGLTTSIDANSALEPESGLRLSRTKGISWRGSDVAKMDPGKTGTIRGWEMVGRDIGSGSGSDGDARLRSRIDRQKETSLQSGETSLPSTLSPSSSDDDDDDDNDSSSIEAEVISLLDPSNFLPASDTKTTSADSPSDHPFTSTPLTFKTSPPSSLTISLIPYLPDIKPHLHTADLVISHAGSGTILETLRREATENASSGQRPNSRRPHLIVVPNETLMDNHQLELAQVIAKGRWAWSALLSLSGPQTTQGSGGRGGWADDLITTIGKALQSLQVVAANSGDEKSGKTPRPFPKSRPERFRRLVDEEMGFI